MTFLKELKIPGVTEVFASLSYAPIPEEAAVYSWSILEKYGQYRSRRESLAMKELTLFVSVKGKKSLDLHFQNPWSIGTWFFVVLAEHKIESFEIHHSKNVHIKYLSGCFICEISGHNVVISTKFRGTQQLVEVCRLSSHGWLLVRVDSTLVLIW